MCNNVIIKGKGDIKMILFTDDCKKNYKETPSGILLAEPPSLIILQGIATLGMVTEDEKVVIYGDKTIESKSFIYV